MYHKELVRWKSVSSVLSLDVLLVLLYCQGLQVLRYVTNLTCDLQLMQVITSFLHHHMDYLMTSAEPVLH